MILHASEKRNIFNLAQSLGYMPKLNSSANAKIDVFQLVPSKTSGTEIVPDMSYAFAIEPGMILISDLPTDGSNSNITENAVFRTTEYLDFKYSGSLMI